MARFRHEIHHKSPALRRVIYGMQHGGYYYHSNQKRKPDSAKRVGENVVIEGEIVSPI